MPDSEGCPFEEVKDESPGKGNDAKEARKRPLLGGENIPLPEEVVGVYNFESPKGRRYRILRTRDKDVYDPLGPSPPDESQPAAEKK